MCCATVRLPRGVNMRSYVGAEGGVHVKALPVPPPCLAAAAAAPGGDIRAVVRGALEAHFGVAALADFKDAHVLVDPPLAKTPAGGRGSPGLVRLPSPYRHRFSPGASGSPPSARAPHTARSPSTSSSPSSPSSPSARDATVFYSPRVSPVSLFAAAVTPFRGQGDSDSNSGIGSDSNSGGVGGIEMSRLLARRRRVVQRGPSLVPGAGAGTTDAAVDRLAK